VPDFLHLGERKRSGHGTADHRTSESETRTSADRPVWSEIKPTRLSKAYQDHPWVFAVYRESRRERDDGQDYTAFLFRDEDRTAFGVKEWLSKDVDVKNDVLENMAHRVVTDAKFRRSLLSDDTDLPLPWRKR
jgi:hypothetical protein